MDDIQENFDKIGGILNDMKDKLDYIMSAFVEPRGHLSEVQNKLETLEKLIGNLKDELVREQD